MSPINRQVLFNVPNVMTFSRIGSIPILMVLLGIQGPHFSIHTNQVFSWVAAIIFIIVGIFDVVDGYYARKYAQVSLLGKFIDPMADKLVHMTALVMLIPMDRIPAWLVVILLFREIFITGLRSVAAGEGLIIAAGDSGKKKTAWLNVGLTGLIIHYPFWGISPYTIGWFCMVVATIMSIYSAYEYLKLFIQNVLNTDSNPK